MVRYLSFFGTPFFKTSLFYFGILTLLFFSSLFGDRSLMVTSDHASLLPQGSYNSPARGNFERLRDPGAPAWQLEPNLGLTNYLLYREHQLPWWNPYQSLGTPYAAAMIPQPFFPLAMAVAIHPSARSVSWFVVLRLLAAGLLSYGFLRLFLDPLPSSLGGVAFMLTGYFVINLNLDNLSTDILVPLVLTGFEVLLRSKSRWAWSLSVSGVWFVLTSGMPESAFILLVFGYFYFIFRVFTSPELRANALRLLGRLAICNILGFSMSAFLLVPMLEMLRNGFDVHRGSPYGMIAIGFTRNVLLYLLPLITGPLYSARYFAARGQIFGYLGISCCILALTAVFTAFRKQGQESVNLARFFALALALAIGKYFGVPPLQQLGYLPLFNLVSFPQYLQPVLAFCVAALCALAADGLRKRIVREELAIAALVISLAVAIGAFEFDAFIPPAGEQNEYFTYSLVLGAVVAGSMLLTSWYSLQRWSKSSIVFVILLMVMTCELTFNYILPVYLYAQTLPSVAADSYRGAPYIDFLGKSGIGFSRVFGRHSELFPSWAGVYQIFDSRMLGGIYPARLFPFARAFFDYKHSATTGELIDRFTGQESPYLFETSLQQRFLQLTSTRFILSPTPLQVPPSEELIQKALRENETLAKTQAGLFNETQFTLDGETRPVLFEHPPRYRVPVQVSVTAATPVLRFSPAFHQDLFNSKCGDGADFILEAAGPDGNTVPLYRRYLDPKHIKSQQHWINESVDLSRFAGKTITLQFTTDGGPKGDNACDWIGWAAPELRPAGEDKRDIPNLKLVYDAENKIYEYAHPLPRASFFRSVKVVNSELEALSLLKNPDVDLTRQAIVVSSPLPLAEANLLRRLEHSDTAPAVPSKIVNFTSQKVRIRTESETPGMVMLTDTFYPGWKVYVDNQRRNLLQAGYIFRGVLVESGTHSIEFRYESSSIALGSDITFAGLIATIFVLFKARTPSSPKL